MGGPDMSAEPPSLVESAVDDLVGETSFVPLADPSPRPARRWWGHPVREYRWQWEFARLMADPVWRGIDVPRGEGSPVMIVPGFLAGDPSLSVLHAWLRRTGYQPFFAGINLNVDCSDRALNRLEQRLCGISVTTGAPVALVGHSRGGLFARALAHRRPDMVSRVVTLGSPLQEPFDISIPTKLAVAGVRRVLTGVGRRATDRGCFTSSCQCPFTRDFSARFPEAVPITSVYTKDDGVVWWEACVVPYAECVEVRGSHIGLAVNRHAYRALADALAPA